MESEITRFSPFQAGCEAFHRISPCFTSACPRMSYFSRTPLRHAFAMLLLDPANPPQLDLTSRNGVMRRVEIATRFREPSAATTRGQVARGLALLWHDHWEAAHEIAQSDEGNPDHDLLHAFVHRREGDFGNAGYWLRSAGGHACFRLISRRVDGALSADHPFRKSVFPKGAWNPVAFLDAVRRGIGTPEENLLRALQAAEMIGYWEWLGGAE